MDANPPERRHPADTLTPTPHPCDGDTTMNFRTATPHPTRRIALAALAALALTSTAAFAEVKAKIGHAMPDTHPQAVAMNKFAELASAYTKGNIKIQAYHSGVLGSDEKQLQAVQAGTQELYIGTLAPLSTR